MYHNKIYSFKGRQNVSNLLLIFEKEKKELIVNDYMR